MKKKAEREKVDDAGEEGLVELRGIEAEGNPQTAGVKEEDNASQEDGVAEVKTRDEK